MVISYKQDCSRRSEHLELVHGGVWIHVQLVTHACVGI